MCNVIPARHCHTHILSHTSVIWPNQRRTFGRTTVIGIMGALGKTKLTSSNLLRRRQFCARPTLYVMNCQIVSCYSNRQVESGFIPACATDRARISITGTGIIAQCRRMETNLSPRPCAMMTVAVCFLIAGTTKGARYDIFV
jgi:hypothetical protein